MMDSYLNLINMDLVEEQIIDIKDFINVYRNDLSTLQDLLFNYSEFNSFDSARWIYFNEIQQRRGYIDFNIFDNLVKTQKLNIEDILLIKCFLLDEFMSDYNKVTINKIMHSIYSMIHITDNFDRRVILGKEKNVILDDLMGSNLSHKIINGHIIDYINFLESIDCAEEGHLITLAHLCSLPAQKFNKSVRNLPSNKDIFTFDFYIKKFYKEETDDLVKNLYKPVLLWWKITNVIPMRPSEFTLKIKRNCIHKKDGKFYISIGRVKVTKGFVKEKRKPSIPILNIIEITKDICELIEDYIECTKFDDATTTLLSYNAYKEFGHKYYEKYRKDVDENLYMYTHREFTTAFTRGNLQSLIDSFYREIIIRKYGDTSIEETLVAGDTRHLAFCSLMLQGISPIDIAMLGGHTTLTAQDHYVGHSKYYIDSEMLGFISNRTIRSEVSNKNLKDIIFSKPYAPNKNIYDCFATEDGIGYCTADLINGTEICDTSRSCIFCSKWWCYPDNANYIKAQEFIKNDCVGSLKQRIKEEEDYLKKLLKTAEVINIYDLIEMEKSCEEEICSQTMKIKSTADEILFLQKCLLEINEENNSIKS